jgi:hypothetical protein
VLLLLLAALVGGLVAFAILLPLGPLEAILGAIVSGAVCIGLAGAWLAYRSPGRQAEATADRRSNSSDDNDHTHDPQKRAAR